MASDPTFPEADVNGELNPGQNKEFEVDAVSSDISNSKDIKERGGEGGEKKRRQERKDCMQSLKRSIVISAVVVAVAGAAFAITKKLKEK